MPSTFHLPRITATNPTTTTTKTLIPPLLDPHLSYLDADSAATLASYHTHHVGPTQCTSVVVQLIAAPVPTVWSLVRRFDNPQAYKHFLKSCHVIFGHGEVGTLRQVHVISGLPAASSTERLEILNEDHHVISFRIVGGDHRLSNYRSVTTLHASVDGGGTVVVESYAVDVPAGNTREETCVFADTIVRCNLQSLAHIAEKMARSDGDNNGHVSNGISPTSCKVS